MERLYRPGKSHYRCAGTSMTDEMLSEAARFFSDNYGIWGSLAEQKIGSFVKGGTRVKISPRLLHEKILPEGADNEFIFEMQYGKLRGVLFATRWKHQGRSIVWVTQLCVHRDHRYEGIGKGLMACLKVGPDGTRQQENKDYAVGILSSHPFALATVLRAFANGLYKVDLEMTKLHAKDIMSTCPVPYVRDAKLSGNLFEENFNDGRISCADTQFWVDHGEPEQALQKIKDNGLKWPFGELPEGHEFLLLVKV